MSEPLFYLDSLPVTPWALCVTLGGLAAAALIWFLSARRKLDDGGVCLLSTMRYKEKYFQRPELLTSVMDRFSEYTVQAVNEKCSTAMQNDNAVVGLYGCGGLFGQLKIKRLIDAIAPKTMGRLLVFFPGTYESNIFRLLNGYDGWNYLAVVLNK